MASNDSGSEASEQEASALVEARFAANLRRLRETAGISQVALAEEMSRRGWPWRQQTVTRIESGKRLVRLGEAKSVADILRTTIDRLTEPTPGARIAEALIGQAAQARTAWKWIADGTAQLLEARAAIQSLNPDGRESASVRVAQAAEEGSWVLRSLTPDGAVSDGFARVAKDRQILAEQHGRYGSVKMHPDSYEQAAEWIAEAVRDGKVVELDLTDIPTRREVELVEAFARGAVGIRRGEVRQIDEVRYQLVPAGWRHA